MSGLRVTVLGGGRSSEHEISLASAASVAEGLREAGHDVRSVRVQRDGTWEGEGGTQSLSPGAGLPGTDVVFPALHGRFGEDGVVQGLLESVGVPYVGAGVLASALSMDKVLFKELMARRGIPQVDYRGVRVRDFEGDPGAVLGGLAPLGLPVFVKPARLGSSVGIVRVAAADGMADALRAAFVYDPLVIVEAAATGVEVECSVLGNAEPEASEPGEIVLHAESGWYDFTAKYTPGGMELVVPARISATARERVRALAVDAFLAAGCEGLARVDCFVDGDDVLINELNTMPGFTPTSVYASLWAASGLAYPALLDRLVHLALERHEASQRFSF